MSVVMSDGKALVFKLPSFPNRTLILRTVLTLTREFAGGMLVVAIL